MASPRLRLRDVPALLAWPAFWAWLLLFRLKLGVVGALVFLVTLAVGIGLMVGGLIAVIWLVARLSRLLVKRRHRTVEPAVRRQQVIWSIPPLYLRALAVWAAEGEPAHWSCTSVDVPTTADFVATLGKRVDEVGVLQITIPRDHVAHKTEWGTDEFRWDAHTGVRWETYAYEPVDATVAGYSVPLLVEQYRERVAAEILRERSTEPLAVLVDIRKPSWVPADGQAATFQDIVFADIPGITIEEAIAYQRQAANPGIPTYVDRSEAVRLCRKQHIGPSGCGRPAVVAGILCREHLLDELRAKHLPIPYDEPELAELYAVAVRVTDAYLKEPPAGRRREPDDRTQLALCALLRPGVDWKQAGAGLDALRRRLSEVPPFRDVTLETVRYGNGSVLYRLRLRVPRSIPPGL